jgi:hypothetical protein
LLPVKILRHRGDRRGPSRSARTANAPGRAEIRDLVDLRAVLQHGFDLRAVLADAARKDGGVSAATLAWLLESVRIGDAAELPPDVGAGELDQFRADLVQQLRRIALPPA